ncbi:hypothetical protein TorRG33x02_240110 [Trema orientale]|uniref:Uncharacterized protein n=1 Tax=Trema orientale TaxID=63057 RepID=A0A2P5DWI0_TREOI|nr:hypothetical protein TorRG33x02_240110 [Trema orientale]
MASFTFEGFAGPECSSITIDNSTFTVEDADEFLLRCAATKVESPIELAEIWRISLQHPRRSVNLFVVKEFSPGSTSCQMCQINGWTHDALSTNIHFVIPEDKFWDEKLPKNLLEKSSHHLLHGVTHCNGVGHLLSLQGYLGGSEFLRGTQLMDLWDRITSNIIHAKRLSLVDSSTKFNCDLRLLYAVCGKDSWFHNWGYKCIDENYGSLVQRLSQENLEQLLGQIPIRNRLTFVQPIINSYQSLSEKKFLVLQDLMGFVLSRVPHVLPVDDPNDDDPNDEEVAPAPDAPAVPDADAPAIPNADVPAAALDEGQQHAEEDAVVINEGQQQDEEDAVVIDPHDQPNIEAADQGHNDDDALNEDDSAEEDSAEENSAEEDFPHYGSSESGSDSGLNVVDDFELEVKLPAHDPNPIHDLFSLYFQLLTDHPDEGRRNLSKALLAFTNLVKLVE